MITDIGQDLSPDFWHGSQTVGTTPVQIVAQSFAHLKGIQIKASDGNAGTVYIGKSFVTADSNSKTDGLPLSAGEGVFIPISDISTIYAIADQAGQKVFWLAI